MRRLQSTALVIVFALLLGGVRWLLPERAVTYTGPRAILDAAFALGLLGLTLLLAASLGRKVLRWLKLQDSTLLEQVVFAVPLGMGILAYGILVLGLVGWLHPWALFLWLVLVGICTWQEWSEIVGKLPGWLVRQMLALKDLSRGDKVVLAFGGLILVLSLVLALTPPWDYDGLMYHLQGPRLFLQAGRILLLPDTWQANGPLTLEMLFTLGLAWGSDTFAKLSHLTCAVLLVLATFAFAQRYLGRREAWLATALLLGVPIFPFWASTAYTDLAWALYEFLALYAVIRWQEVRERRWLLLAGLAMGWAIGSKYLALESLGVLGLWILWQNRRAQRKEVLLPGVLFGATALFVGAPWYLKNWLLAGNPVYPFFFGGLGWDAERLEQLMVFLGSFGAGRTLLDYALLPWNLYAQNTRFGGFKSLFDHPGLLLPLAMLYPLAPRDGATNSVAYITGLGFVLWALGSQQTRFLLPLFPALALLSATVLVRIAHRLGQQRPGWARLVAVAVGTMMAATLVFQAILYYSYAPFNVILGLESKDSFLQRVVYDYPALQFIQSSLSNDERVLMMWDGQGYYCDARCLPDAEQNRWTRLAGSASRLADVAGQLKAQGVSHLLYVRRDAEFLVERDPTGEHQQALEFFRRQFLPFCGDVVYVDLDTVLVRVTCGR